MDLGPRTFSEEELLDSETCYLYYESVQELLDSETCYLYYESVNKLKLIHNKLTFKKNLSLL
jgi:hypothetical protein